MTGAEAVVHLMKKEGIEHIFQLPGSQILELLDSLYDSPIRNIMTRHEQGAAFMAEGYARAKKSFGICMSTAGPGAPQLVSPSSPPLSRQGPP